MYFFQFWGLGSLRSRCQQTFWLSGEPEPTSWFIAGPLHCHLSWYGERGAFWGLLEGYWSHSWGLCHPHDLITSQRPHPLMLSHWGLSFNIYEFCSRYKHSVYSRNFWAFFLFDSFSYFFGVPQLFYRNWDSAIIALYWTIPSLKYWDLIWLCQ